MDLELTDRVVMCTGALGGIGVPTVRTLADEGARLFLMDRDDGELRSLASTLPGGGHEVFACDLRDPGCPGTAVARCVERLGRLDGLANLAAVMVPTDFDSVDAAVFDLHYEVNVRAAFFLARAAADVMDPAGGGRILLASSGAWLSGGLPDRLPYATSKGAITTLVKSLAKALGPRGICVNGIAPGMVDSPMMHDGLDPEVQRALEQSTPLGRFARPEEIAQVITLLLSPKTSFVSGAMLVVSGGLILH